jgi:hypothetical protein
MTGAVELINCDLDDDDKDLVEGYPFCRAHIVCDDRWKFFEGGLIIQMADSLQVEERHRSEIAWSKMGMKIFLFKGNEVVYCGRWMWDKMGLISDNQELNKTEELICW